MNENVANKDIYMACCGKDDDGNNKAMVSIECAFYSADKDKEIVHTIVLNKPYVNIVRQVEYSTVDITFDDPSDYEFIHTWKMLDGFIIPENSADEEKRRAPSIDIAICPKAYEGRYLIVGLYSAFSLYISKRSKDIDTLRFQVNTKYLNVCEVDTDKVDINAAELEAYEEMERGII